MALLPDWERTTIEAWLGAHPENQIVSRDRDGGYGEAVAKALPHAIQVADRWHLFENACAAFLGAVRKSMRSIRIEIGATTINRELLACAERLQYEGYLRREETNAAVMALSKDGVSIKRIVHRTGYSRGLVRQIIRGHRTDVFRVRLSTLDAYLLSLDAQWADGHRKGAELWRRVKARGYYGFGARGHRVGDEAPASGKGLRSIPSEGSIRQNNSASNDRGARSPEQSR